VLPVFFGRFGIPPVVGPLIFFAALALVLWVVLGR